MNDSLEKKVNHEFYMKIALKEAEKSLAIKVLPVGAVLVVDGEVVAKSHKDEKNSYHLDHAEISLVRDYFKGKNLKRDDHDISLYTTLEPCMMCLGTIMHLPIKNIIYAAHDPYGGGCCVLRSSDLPFRHKKNPIEVRSEICEKESKELFKKFLEINESLFYKDETNPLVWYLLN